MGGRDCVRMARSAAHKGQTAPMIRIQLEGGSVPAHRRNAREYGFQALLGVGVA